MSYRNKNENKNENKINILITGVGGQGVLLAAKILGKASVRAGKNVMVSEIHGMAQRGGAVVCNVRIGKVYGSLIADGTADCILSMEPVEALRYISKIRVNEKERGIVLTDINPVIPSTVSVGEEEYPSLDKVYEEIESVARLIKIDALKVAKECGASITKNMVMLGTLAGIDILPFDATIVMDAMKESISERHRKVNEEAFKKGMKFIKEWNDQD